MFIGTKQAIDDEDVRCDKRNRDHENKNSSKHKFSVREQLTSDGDERLHAFWREPLFFCSAYEMRHRAIRFENHRHGATLSQRRNIS
jgi:hypothetical protein